MMGFVVMADLDLSVACAVLVICYFHQKCLCWVNADERTNHLGSAWKYFRTLDNRAFMHARRLSIYKYQITNGL